MKSHLFFSACVSGLVFCAAAEAQGQEVERDIALLTQTADFVVKYGFLAVGLVLIFIIAPAIYKLADSVRVAQGSAIFGLAFVVAYGVISVIKAVAPQWISAQRVMLIGTVRGVPNGHAVQMQSDLWRPGHAYTKREFDPSQANIFNFRFILVTSQAPSCLAVALASTDSTSDNSYLFNITPVSADDMASNAEVLAEFSEEQDGPTLKVWREIGEKQVGAAVMLQPLSSSDPGCVRVKGRAANEWSVFLRAWAQSALTLRDLETLLQSDDVFVRRNARIALSKMGDNAFTLIDQLLARNDNYRLQLGAAVALSLMPQDQRRRAPASVFQKLRGLQNSQDKVMKDTVFQALQ
jgi:hypothetical protein